MASQSSHMKGASGLVSKAQWRCAGFAAAVGGPCEAFGQLLKQYRKRAGSVALPVMLKQ